MTSTSIKVKEETKNKLWELYGKELSINEILELMIREENFQRRQVKFKDMVSNETINLMQGLAAKYPELDMSEIVEKVSVLLKTPHTVY